MTLTMLKKTADLAKDGFPKCSRSKAPKSKENKIILDECSTVVEIDHVRNLIDCLERKNG